MVQQVGRSRIDCERAGVIFVARVDGKGSIQIHVEMDLRGHGPQVARSVAVDGVDGEEAVWGAEDTGPGSSGIGGAVVEVAVSVVVGAGGEAVV